MILERWSADTLVLIESLTPLERGGLRMLRDWSSGLDGQQTVWTDLYRALGGPRATVALRAFERSLGLIRRNGARALRIRPPGDGVVSLDEQLFTRLIAQAQGMDRETALLTAMLLVRPHLAPALLDHMTQFALHLRCMELARDAPGTDSTAPQRMN